QITRDCLARIRKCPRHAFYHAYPDRCGRRPYRLRRSQCSRCSSPGETQQGCSQNSFTLHIQRRFSKSVFYAALFSCACALSMESCVYTDGLTLASPPPEHRFRLMRTSLRWLFVLLISALLHMIAIGWLKGKLHFPTAQPAENTTVIPAVLE